MNKKSLAKILGIGSYLPKKVLTNADLEALVETTDEWITTRTGIKERRIASDEESPSFMGIKAAEVAVKNSGIDPSKIDLVLAATMTPDHYSCPSTAALVQGGLKMGSVPVLDLQAACTGYLYALSTAKAFIESGLYRNILVVATEKMSSIVDFSDRATCVLFGDGATAAVISAEGAGLAIEHVDLAGDGALAHLIEVPVRKPHITLKGKEVFKQAVRRMATSSETCLSALGLQHSDISWLVPHQANGRIIDALGRHMNLPDEKVFRVIHKYGNTSASSIGIALDELLQTQKTSTGDRFLLVAFGAGLTWGAAVLTKTE